MIERRRRTMNYLTLNAFIIVSTLISQVYPSSVIDRPSDISARVGSTVILRCAVSPMAAAEGVTVQWAKDRELLGTHREIGQYNRLRMVGNDSTSQFHLRITDLTLLDDGLYACQLVFRPNGTRVQLEARLQVIVPPRRVTLQPRHGDGATVEVRQGDQLNVQCAAYGSRPAADIVWLRDGLAIQDPLSVHTVHDEREDKLVDTTTTLLWNVTRSDHGNMFTCLARHAALQNENMVTNFTMSVMYPTSTPVIRGYLPIDTVTAGATVNLQCSARNGNPAPQLYWYRGNARIDTSFETSKEFTTNEYSFTADATDNGARYECRAHSRSFEPVVNNVKLRVNFAPSTARIEGDAWAKAGHKVQLTCTSSPSSPPSRVHWAIDGRPIQSTQYTERNMPAADGNGYLTASNVTVVVDEGRRSDMNVKCTMRNDKVARNRPASDSHLLQVLYAPDDMVIYGDDGNDGGVEEGGVHSLTCAVPGGNPFANVTWWKGSLKLTEGVTYSVSGRMSQAQLSLPVTRADHQAIFRCIATSDALDVPLVMNTSALNVYFAPRQVRVTTPKSPLLADGDDSILLCHTSSSNPAPHIVWRANGKVVEGGGRGELLTNKTSAHGGFELSNRLSLLLTPDDDDALYTCTAESKYWPAHPSHSKQLSVEYKPRFMGNTLNRRATVRIGSSVQIALTAEANPSSIVYKWYRHGALLGQGYNGRVHVRNAEMSVNGAQKDDAGDYVCEAGNAHGRANITVTVQVNYPPTAVMRQRLVSVAHHKTGVLLCDIDAMPFDVDAVRWYRERLLFAPSSAPLLLNAVDTPRVNITQGVRGSVLTIDAIDKSSAGEYKCVVNTTLGTAEAIGFLVTHTPPLISRLPAYVKSAAMIGEAASFICRSTAVPDVVWAWRVTKGDESTIVTNSTKFSISARRVDEITFESQLTVRQVHAQDYSNLYSCTAENAHGQDDLIIRLTQKQQPDAPSNVRIVEASPTSVTVAWTPGFDGGDEQSFNISYRPTNGGRHISLSVRNETNAVLDNLEEDKEYVVFVRAVNHYGASSNSSASAITFTPSAAEEIISSHTIVPSAPSLPLPLYAIALIAVIAMGALCLNCCLICCFVKRHQKRKLKEKAAVLRGRPLNTSVDKMPGGGKTVLMYAQDELQPTYRPYSQLSDPDEQSIRTVIEVDANGQPIYIERISPGTHHTYLVDDQMMVDNYAQVLRTHPMQQYLGERHNTPLRTDPMDAFNVPQQQHTLTRRASPVSSVGTAVMSNGGASPYTRPLGRVTASPAMSTFRHNRHVDFEYNGDLV